MTNGQPSGTLNGNTIVSTDSAATEILNAMAADDAAAQEWVNSFLNDASSVERESRVLLDTVQLLAVGGVSYYTVLRDSVLKAQADGIKSGQVYELFTSEQVDYARGVVTRMGRLMEGAPVNSSFEYRKPYLKQRQLVKIVSDLQTTSSGKQAYQVYLGTLDPTTPMTEPVWRKQDLAGGQYGDIMLHVTETATGTRYSLRRSGEHQVAVLGNSELMSRIIQLVMDTNHWKLFTTIGATEPSLKQDAIRFSHRGQLVFWQAQHVARGVVDYLAAIEAAAVPAVTSTN